MPNPANTGSREPFRRIGHKLSSFAPKYHACVFKVQIIIDLNGRIVYYSVPHLGVTSDTKIWSKTRPRFNEGEFVLADGAYLSSLMGQGRSCQLPAPRMCAYALYVRVQQAVRTD